MLKSPSITRNHKLRVRDLVLAVVLDVALRVACRVLASTKREGKEGSVVYLARVGGFGLPWLGHAEGQPGGSDGSVWPGRRWCRALSASRRRARGARGVWSALVCLYSMLVLDASHRRYHLKVSPVWTTLGSGFDACAAMLGVYKTEGTYDGT